MITDRIDAITRVGPERRTAIPPCPRSVKIELTGRCNFRCAFCATAKNLREKSDMSWDFYAGRLLPGLRAAGVEEVGMFFLGESMLLPWLPNAIAEAKRRGFSYVFLTTNASLSTPEKVRDCMAAGLDSLKFSLNYADAEQFAEIARVKPALFPKMLENIKAAHEVREMGGYGCGLYASYIAYDGEQGERMKALVHELSPYLDQVYALPLYSQANLIGDEMAEKGGVVRAGNPGRLGNMQEPIPCWSLFSEGRVTWDGKLAACCFDHNGAFEMGDLNTMDFMDAWHSGRFQALRQAHLKGHVEDTACAQCVAWN